MTVNLQNPAQTALPRFGAKKRPETETQRLYRQMQEMGGNTDAVTFVSANELKDAREKSPVGKSQKKISRGKQGLYAFGIALLSLFGTLIPGNAILNTSAENRATSAYREAIGPDHEALIRAIRAAETGDSEALGDAHTRWTALLHQIPQIMESRVSDERDRQLLEKLHEMVERGEALRPHQRAGEIASALLTWMKNDAGLTHSADAITVNEKLDGLRRRLDFTPEIQDLSGSEKDLLARELKQAVVDLYNRYGERQLVSSDFLRPPITARLLAQTNLTLEDLRQAETAEGTVKLFQQYMANPKNAATLTGDARELFVKHGSEILAAVEAQPFPYFSLMLMLGLLGLAAGGGAYGFTRRTEALGLKAAYADLNAALEVPHIFVTNADRGDADRQTSIARFNDEIKAKTEEMAAVIRQVHQQEPVVRAFLDDLFPQGLPNGAWLRKAYSFAVVENLMGRQSRADRLNQVAVNHTDYMEPYYYDVDMAWLSGNFLKTEISEEDGKPASVNDLAAAKANPGEFLKAELARIDRVIGASQKIYANRMFAEAIKKSQMEALQAEVEAKDAEFLRLGRIFREGPAEGDRPVSRSEVTLAHEAKTQAEEKLAKTREKFEEAERMALYTRGFHRETILPLEEYRDRIAQAYEDHNYSVALDTLKQLREETDEHKVTRYIADEVAAEVREKQAASTEARQNFKDLTG